MLKPWSLQYILEMLWIFSKHLMLKSYSQMYFKSMYVHRHILAFAFLLEGTGFIEILCNTELLWKIILIFENIKLIYVSQIFMAKRDALENFSNT